MSVERGTADAEIGGRASVANVVCFAMEVEAKDKVLRSRSEILITGIGKQNSERTFRDLLNKFSPRRVFTCGFAGALNPELKLGEVIFDTSDATLDNKLRIAGAKPAKFFCSPRIAIRVAEKQELRRTTGADAVEMESEAIHAVCRERGIPCATVRVISDEAGEDLPMDFNKLANADLSLNYGKLALAVAKSPKTIPALMQFQKRTKFAAERLAEILKKVIGAE